MYKKNKIFFKNGSWFSRNTYFKFYWNRKYAKINHFLKAYLKSLPETETIHFIQIGSNNQICWPIEAYINERWQSVLIEPITKKAEELRKKYHESNFSIENIAISDKNEKKVFYSIEAGNDSPSWVSYLSSFKTFNIEWLKENYKDIKINELILDTLTYKDIVKKYNLKKVNILQIDTEGYDFKILNSIDLTKFDIDLIIFESKHLSKFEKSKIRNLAKRNNYAFFEETIDSLFFRTDVYKYLDL